MQTITSFLASPRTPQKMTSRKHTRKWFVLILISFSGLTSENQALKWHPDRNAGSEEASQKFKQVSPRPVVLFVGLPFTHAHYSRYRKPLRSLMINRNALFTISLARRGSKAAVPHLAQGLEPTHLPDSLASLAVGALLSRLQACQAARVGSRHRTQ